MKLGANGEKMKKQISRDEIQKSYEDSKNSETDETKKEHVSIKGKTNSKLSNAANNASSGQQS